MTKKTHPARIVVARTPTIENLLQKLWQVRPEIRDKPTMTVALAILALLRESSEEGVSTIAAHNVLHVSTAPKPVTEMETVVETKPVEAKEIHPDSMWN